jgi:hypothetical protein
MEGAEYDELKSDIAKNGLLEAIWLHPDESIIDGRNRHRACIETETRPRFRTWDGKGSLVSFVVSMNLRRRQLTYDQRVGIALKLEPAFAEEAKRRQGRRTDLANIPPNSAECYGEAAKQAAEQANVGKTAVKEMKSAQHRQAHCRRDNGPKRAQKAKSKEKRAGQTQSIAKKGE